MSTPRLIYDTDYNVEWLPAPGDSFELIDNKDEVDFITSSCAPYEKKMIEWSVYYAIDFEEMAKRLSISSFQVHQLYDQAWEKILHKASMIKLKEITFGI